MYVDIYKTCTYLLLDGNKHGLGKSLEEKLI